MLRREQYIESKEIFEFLKENGYGFVFVDEDQGIPNYPCHYEPQEWGYYMMPTYFEIQQWFIEKKQIAILPDVGIVDAEGNFKFWNLDIWWGDNFEEYNDKYSSYLEALKEGINKVIKYLKENVTACKESN